MTSEFLIVAKQVIQRLGRPMTASELVEYGKSNGLFTDRIAGKTPSQTMKSKLSVHIRRLGARSDFVRTARGQFFLRSLLDDSQSVYHAQPIRKPQPKENVLVFPAKWLEDLSRFQGISTTPKSLSKRLFNESILTYANRQAAELDDTFKQIITYVILTRGNSVLAFKRGDYTRVADFLRGSHCVGFGGHVTEDDRSLFDSDMGIESCVTRELSEELRLPPIDKSRLQSRVGLQLIGLLNDDSSAVGQRHFAFVFRYEVSDDPYWDKPDRGERSVTQLRWLSPGKTRPLMWEFEYWSQLCLGRFFPNVTKSAPTYRLRRTRPLRPPHILCVIGTVGSGKSAATKVLEDEFGYTTINTGRLVAELLGIPPVPSTPREDFQKRAYSFIKKATGPRRLAKAIVQRMRDDSGGRVLVDGLRQKSTLEELRRLAGSRSLGLLYVHTTPAQAYNFYRERERSDITILDFLKIRNAEVESEVEGMIVDSDAVLYNWTGRDQYRRAVQKLMARLLE